MKRYAPWLLAAFVLALLTPGLCADRLTRVFLDSPIERASYLDIAHLLVPAVAVMVPAVKPGKFWLHVEARRSRAGPDESIPPRSNLSFDHALLRPDDTGPPWIDLCRPPGAASSRSAVEVARPAGPRRRPQKGRTTPPKPRKMRLPQKSGFCNV